MTHEIVDMTAACISRLRDAGRVEQTKFPVVPIWETVLVCFFAALTLELFWDQDFAGTRSLLAPELFWHQPFFWYQHYPGVSIF
jgi:hypothetical protein